MRLAWSAKNATFSCKKLALSGCLSGVPLLNSGLYFVVLAIALMIVDSRWLAFEPARKAVSVAIYPFQRLVLAPRDLYEHFDSWSNAAARARSEKEALQRQRIELAQLATHAAQLATENEQLRRLLNVSDTVTQQIACGFCKTLNAFNQHLVFNKGVKWY